MDYFTLDKELSKINEGDGTPTERNLQEILVLLNWLEQVGVVGASSSVLEYPVRMLDNHCQILLRTLAFDPSDTPHFSLFKKGEDERLRDIQGIAELSKKNPEAAVPYAIIAYCESISKRIAEDLLAFATDFKAARNLQFRISFSSFAASFSSTERDSEQKRIEKRLQEMEKAGFVIKPSRRKEHTLVDCDANRRFLREYCEKTFGREPFEICTYKGTIQELRMSVQYDEYAPALKKEKPDVVPSKTLSADGVICLKKEISNARSALASYDAMNRIGSGNTVLACLRGCVKQIETVTSIHSTIWQEIETEVAETRSKNQQIRAIEKTIQESVTPKLIPQVREIFAKAEKNLESLVESMGFYLHDFHLLQYGHMDIVLSRSCTVFREPKIKLDGYSEDRDCDFYVFNTMKNMNTIMEAVKSIIPSASLDSYKAKTYAGAQYISEIHILTSDPMDFLRMLQMEPVSDKETSQKGE